MNKYYLLVVLLLVSLTLVGVASNYPTGAWIGYNADTGKFIPVAVDASGTVLVEGIGGECEPVVGNALVSDVVAAKTFSTVAGNGLTGTRAPAMIQASGQAGTDAGGVAYPSPRFVDNGDDTITDKLTGLMWAKNLNLAASDFGRYVSWTEAKATCEGKNIGGHTDWRLPNVKEMDSLMDWSSYPLANYLTSAGFINLVGQNFWTNTVARNDASYAFWVSSFNGVRNADVKTALYSYVPVRGPIAL